MGIDTNILAYAEGVNDSVRQSFALDVLDQLPADETFLPVQVLGELFNVLIGKGRRNPKQARDSVLVWYDIFVAVETSKSVILRATDLSATHGLYIWDAVVVAAAAEANCRLLLSEDMQDGFTWDGVTVVNPFAADRHPLLEAILRAPADT